MAIILTTTTKNTIVDAVVDSIDLGTTDANGDLVLMTGADAEVATLALSNPSFGAAAAGVASADAISDDTDATGGTVALFKFQNRDNVEVLRGTVTATGGGGDLTLSSVTVGAGDTVSISSFTVTAP